MNIEIPSRALTRRVALNRFMRHIQPLVLAVTLLPVGFTAVAAPTTPTVDSLCARNVDGQRCIKAPQAATSTQAPANASAKYNPGFYMLVGTGDKYTFDTIKNNPDFIGINKVYYWSALEPAFGVYDFSTIEADLAYAQSIGKRFSVLILATQYDGRNGPKTPTYMWNDPSYGGGPTYYGNFERDVQNGGWIPVFWNKNLKERFAALYQALGHRFDNEPYFEALIMDETSVFPPSGTVGYSPSALMEAFKANALAAKRAFPNTSVLQQVNFAPYDVKAFMEWLIANNIGMSCPDIILDSGVYKNLHSTVYPIMRDNRDKVVIGPQVQWDNYVRINPATGQPQTAQEMLDFAESLNPHYMFWMNRTPYFSQDTVPTVRRFIDNGGALR